MTQAHTTQAFTHRNRTAKPAQLRVIRDFTPDQVLSDAEMTVDRSELDALIKQAFKMNSEFGSQLEDAVNAIIIPLVEAGFIAGWQAHKNPETLIFTLSAS